MEKPTSSVTLEALRELIYKARGRGDETMAVLLSGVALYATLGREFELLEQMREFAMNIEPAVENTPSADQLRDLYNRE